MNDFFEILTALSRVFIWWVMSFGLIYVASNFYFVKELSIKIKLMLIIGVILFSQFISKIIVS